ncbi:hypothetical protein HK101_008464 [Irineochytrium annulatum]|nr:hypothetical protein HK101_008464 [Irineochytrium annulatum]
MITTSPAVVDDPAETQETLPIRAEQEGHVSDASEADGLKARLKALEDELERVKRTQNQQSRMEPSALDSDSSETGNGNDKALQWWQRGYLTFTTAETCEHTHLTSYPDILKGYRVNYTGHQNLVSLFHWHNESINCWSHYLTSLGFFLAFILTAAQAFQNARTVQDAADRAVIVVYLFVIACTMLFSALFHTNLSHKDARAYKCFGCLDYAGISISNSIIAMTQCYFLYYCDLSVRNSWMVVLGIITLVGLLGPLFPFWWTEIFAKYRLTVFAVTALICYGPFIQFVATFGSKDIPTGLFMPATIAFIVIQVGGTLLYSYRLPERLFPGRFDYVFSSHNIWHVLSTVCAVLHAIVLFDLARYSESTLSCGTDAPVPNPFKLVVPPRVSNALGYPTWRFPDPAFDMLAATMNTLNAIAALGFAAMLACRYNFTTRRYDPLPSTGGWSARRMRLFNQDFIPLDYLGNIIFLYILATMGAAIAVLFFDLSKFFSVPGAIHNVSEFSLCLLLMRRWRRLGNLLAPAYVCLAIVWFLSSNLPWPLDAVLFKGQGLTLDFILFQAFMRLYFAQPTRRAEREARLLAIRDAREGVSGRGSDGGAGADEGSATDVSSEADGTVVRKWSTRARKQRAKADGPAAAEEAAIALMEEEEEVDEAVTGEWTMRGKVALCCVASFLHWFGNAISTLTLNHFGYTLFQYFYVVSYPMYGWFVYKLKPDDKIRRFKTAYGWEVAAVIVSFIIAAICMSVLVMETTIATEKMMAANEAANASLIVASATATVPLAKATTAA